MRLTHAIASLAVLFSLVPGSAEAQEVQQEPRRQGFWVSVGIGAGATTADVASNLSHWGGAGFLRLGGVPDEHVVLGTEMMGWVTGQNDVVTTRGVVTLFVQYYPSKTGGLFFKGGLGGAGLAVWTDLSPGTTIRSNGGFGMTLGTGYEFRLSPIGQRRLGSPGDRPLIRWNGNLVTVPAHGRPDFPEDRVETWTAAPNDEGPPLQPSVALFCSRAMPEARVELARRCRHGILSPACLPFHHSGLGAEI